MLPIVPVCGDYRKEVLLWSGLFVRGDCLETPKGWAIIVDSVVTDPPYEIGFMGKAWDGSGVAYNVQLWRECLRVLKPGGRPVSVRCYSFVSSYGGGGGGCGVLKSGTVFIGRMVASPTTSTSSPRRLETRNRHHHRRHHRTVGPRRRASSPSPRPRHLPYTLERTACPVPQHRHRPTTHPQPPRLPPVRAHCSTGGIAYHEWSEWRVKEAADISRAPGPAPPVAGWHDITASAAPTTPPYSTWVWTEALRRQRHRRPRLPVVRQARLVRRDRRTDGPVVLHKRYDRTAPTRAATGRRTPTPSRRGSSPRPGASSPAPTRPASTPRLTCCGDVAYREGGVPGGGATGDYSPRRRAVRGLGAEGPDRSGSGLCRCWRWWCRRAQLHPHGA